MCRTVHPFRRSLAQPSICTASNRAIRNADFTAVNRPRKTKTKDTRDSLGKPEANSAHMTGQSRLITLN